MFGKYIYHRYIYISRLLREEQTARCTDEQTGEGQTDKQADNQMDNLKTNPNISPS